MKEEESGRTSLDKAKGMQNFKQILNKVQLF